jgi:putative nucleotidyltransferase with HDIG domain
MRSRGSSRNELERMSIAFRRRRRFERALVLSFERNERVRLAIVIGVLALLSSIVLLFSPPTLVSYEVGDVADRSLRANRSVTFVSEVLTQEARDRAAGTIAPVYRIDPSVASQQAARLEQLFTRIGAVRADAQKPREQRLSDAQREGLSGPVAAAALDMPPEEWDRLVREAPDILRGVLARELRADDVEQARADVPKVLPAGWSLRQKQVGAELIQRGIAPNSTLDAAATERARQEAREKVPAIFVSVAAGEVIVRDGSVVTAQDVEKLRVVGLQSPGVDWKVAVGLLLWALLVAAMFALYLQRFQPEVWADTRKVAVAGGALIFVVALSRAVPPTGTLLPYFIPYAAVGLALSSLIGGRTALATQTATALHVGVLTGRIELVAYVLLPTLLGMSAVRLATSARDFIVATTLVAAGNFGVMASFVLLARTTDALGLAQLAAAGIANAIESGLFAFAGVIFIGHLTRIPTVFELRELGDPNHPLLRQLLLRTPGTYHHSLLVANLAERAAEVIGADPLVARVGAYYHDIGKMRNPSAFIENQAGEKNPHDELDPLVSAQIVAAHVRDGLALADRYRLPQAIREMIPGHHGNSLVKYFYQQAVARGDAPDSEAYRYPGPRPRSREAGIVMLADGVEASVRSLPAKTMDEIRRMVDKIVSERVAEGQLDDCDLTLADVQRIKEAFVELLAGVYHERIPYPEDRITQLPPTRGAAGIS